MEKKDANPLEGVKYAKEIRHNRDTFPHPQNPESPCDSKQAQEHRRSSNWCSVKTSLGWVHKYFIKCGVWQHKQNNQNRQKWQKKVVSNQTRRILSPLACYNVSQQAGITRRNYRRKYKTYFMAFSFDESV